MRKSHFLFFLFFTGFFSAYSQNEDSVFIRRIADEILLNGKAYDHLRELTKQIGGRLSGSPQMYKAEQWGLQKMRSDGANKAWLQECMVPHWIRGKEEAFFNVHGKMNLARLDVIALGNSIGTGPKAVSAQLIKVSSFDELETRKDEIRGKIVFYNYKFNPTFVSTFQSYGDAVQYRGAGASRAAKYG